LKIAHKAAACAALLLPALAACQTPSAIEPSAGAGGVEQQGLAFAQGACGGCHAVERFDLSPNADAPPFVAIVNREGLSADTLHTWLRDAHNYPEEMEFDLNPAQVDVLIDYMLQLKDPAYRPTIG
jgi:mono/diheme cytochrome c family protein